MTWVEPTSTRVSLGPKVPLIREIGIDQVGQDQPSVVLRQERAHQARRRDG